MKQEENQLLKNKDPIVQDLLNDLKDKLSSSGIEFKTQYNKTSIHLMAKSAFLGIHFMKSCLKLTIVSTAPIKSLRISKTEKASVSRFYNDIKIFSKKEINEELLKWIRESYELRS